MTKRRRRVVVIAVVIVLLAAVILTVAYFPRSFAQAVGGSYDPAKTPQENGLQEVYVILSGVTVDETRELHLDPDDPAAAELTALLDSQSWRPVYPEVGRQVELDYVVMGVYLVGDPYGGGRPGARFFLDGSGIAQAGQGGDLKDYRMDPALQQEILDLLLEQPYTLVS
ncbi:MAG TPA: hypothetical protein H9844_04595 [Candidatus Evtepia faecigallinarum]|nr:hypothetical protein [Candidatus Evtepia faecigallinarum]